MVGVVCGVNKEQLPLLTITGITRFNKVFTMLRAYLPNQRRWMFKWIFCIVVPLFLGKRTVKKITIIISDGDAQEYMSIDDFISQFCPQAKRVRCGWHIINR